MPTQALTLRQYQLWAVEDTPEYYDGHYLTYTNAPARRLRRFATSRAGDAQWSEHLALLQDQLQDFQAALAAVTRPRPKPAPLSRAEP